MDFGLRGATLTAPTIDLSFPHCWQAEILPARPLILPKRHFVYPLLAEEVERGALEVLIRPQVLASPSPIGAQPSQGVQAFLATFALGFLDPVVPTGLWSTPRAGDLCAVSGGYAYLIDTNEPELFTMVPFRPVLEVRPLIAEALLLFVCHRNLVAWGPMGMAWESERLSAEGITQIVIENGILRGLGWDMQTDKETPFALDLRTGLRV